MPPRATPRPAWYSALDPCDVWTGGGILRPQVPAVYVCEDRHGRVIYVGQTGDWWKRRVEHIGTSAWWPQVALIHLLRQPRARDMRARDEAILLQLLQPPNNVYGTNRDPRRGKRTIDGPWGVEVRAGLQILESPRPCPR